LEIGRNDAGHVVGLDNAAALLVELPNKIRSTMGIVVDVNLRNEANLNYIAIQVDAHPNAISYRGKYYYRSGSVNQELTGYALDEFILRKYGRTWDSALVPRVDVTEFYHDAFDIFRKKAVTSKRLAPDDVAVSDAELLQALKLVQDSYLLKAALLLFYQDPDRWCYGSFIKIGYFKNDADLFYQDEIGGPLIGIADKVIDTIYTKYFKGLIHYEGIQRIDNYPMPRDVLREAILNAVVHRDYSTGNPIHIKIYDDHVIIYNSCCIAEKAINNFCSEGRSNPHNPLIAGAFFRSGQIEAWGRGIEKMRNGCISDSLPEPEFEVTSTMFSICFHIRNTRVEDNVGINETQKKIMDLIMKNAETTTQQIANSIGITKRRVESNIRQLKIAGVIERLGARKNGKWIVKQ
jgi:ATP-dependent DNA helicase RecG